MATGINELTERPRFAPGTKVRCLSLIRNDGTFPGRRTGEVLITPGETGYINSIGTFLQRHYIYDVDFYERGVIVGMRGHELEPVGGTHENHAEEDD